jgi:hypothetical protein
VRGSWLLLVLLVVALLGALAYASWRGSQQTEDDWRRIEAFRASALIDGSGTESAHTTLLPCGRDGEAWDHYRAAATLAGAAAAEGAPFERCWADGCTALAELGAGARSARCRTPHFADVERDERTLPVFGLAALASAGGRAIGGWQQRAEAARAIDLSLVLLTLALDLDDTQVLLGELVGGNAVDAVVGRWPDECIARLDDAQAARLADALQRFEQRWRPELRSVRTIVLYGIDRAARGIERGEPPAWWRRMGSPRAQYGTDLCDMLDDLDAVDAASAGGWARRRAALQAVFDASRHERGTLRSQIRCDFAAAETMRREVTARLRLLRLSLAHRLGTPLVLADPLGDGPLVRR